jgi:uncharacterized cysteine cluster protein YcgN (CxxCxxCC family)
MCSSIEKNKLAPFWEQALGSLDTEQWEQLCDGCGRCCLKKLKDHETEEVFYTRVICRHFEEGSSRCDCYGKRSELVPDCVVVSHADREEFIWMPDTCAYRLRSEDKPLFSWHPLIAGDRKLMKDSGISVVGRVISEEFVHDEGVEEHVIRWVSN